MTGTGEHGFANPPGGRRDRDPDGGIALDRRHEERGLHRFTHEAMATVFEVHAEHPDERYAAQAAHAAFELTDGLERELSRFVPNSDISRINRLAAGEVTRVSPSTMECLVVGRHVFDLTGGAFDIAIGTGLPSLELDPVRFVVRATQPGVAVDLGGIGKGYAVDRMAGVLEEWGISRALVHGGFSSVLALDPPGGGQGWPLTLSDPAEPARTLVRLSPGQTALGASGLRKGLHILDPRTGRPATNRRAAWVAVPRPEASPTAAQSGVEPRAGAVSDALATAFMLMDLQDIEALCEQNPGLEAWVLLDEGGGTPARARLLHVGGSRPGYTSASPP